MDKDRGISLGSLTWPLKMDGWKMSFLLGFPIFRGYVKLRGGSVWGVNDRNVTCAADFVEDYCALPKPKGSKLAPED